MSDRVVVMSNGRIEQVGTPADIYNSPSTEFVARFVGTLNLLPSVVLDPGSGRVRVAGHELRAAAPLALPAGGEAIAALRPEAVVLGDGEAGANVLPGDVVDVTFLGSIVRIRVRIAEVDAIVALDRFNSPGATLPAIGEAVRVSFQPEALVLLEHTR
jgi:putative spermidine/putrescine transport system ATP-binding protein